jgi:hypothetical protein
MNNLNSENQDNLVSTASRMVIDTLAPKLQAWQKKHDNHQSNQILDNGSLAILTLTSPMELKPYVEKLLTLKSQPLSGVGIILIPFTLTTPELAPLVWPLARLAIRIISSNEPDLHQHAQRLMHEENKRRAATLARWEEQDKITNKSS